MSDDILTTPLAKALTGYSRERLWELAKFFQLQVIASDSTVTSDDLRRIIATARSDAMNPGFEVKINQLAGMTPEVLTGIVRYFVPSAPFPIGYNVDTRSQLVQRAASLFTADSKPAATYADALNYFRLFKVGPLLLVIIRSIFDHYEQMKAFDERKKEWLTQVEFILRGIGYNIKGRPSQDFVIDDAAKANTQLLFRTRAMIPFDLFFFFSLLSKIDEVYGGASTIDTYVNGYRLPNPPSLSRDEYAALDKTFGVSIAHYFLTRDGRNVNLDVNMQTTAKIWLLTLFRFKPTYNNMQMRTKIVQHYARLGQQTPEINYLKNALENENLPTDVDPNDPMELVQLKLAARLVSVYHDPDYNVRFFRDFLSSDKFSKADLIAQSKTIWLLLKGDKAPAYEKIINATKPVPAGDVKAIFDVVIPDAASKGDVVDKLISLEYMPSVETDLSTFAASTAQLRAAAAAATAVPAVAVVALPSLASIQIPLPAVLAPAAVQVPIPAVTAPTAVHVPLSTVVQVPLAAAPAAVQAPLSAVTGPVAIQVPLSRVPAAPVTAPVAAAAPAFVSKTGIIPLAPPIAITAPKLPAGLRSLAQAPTEIRGAIKFDLPAVKTDVTTVPSTRTLVAGDIIKPTLPAEKLLVDWPDIAIGPNQREPLNLNKLKEFGGSGNYTKEQLKDFAAERGIKVEAANPSATDIRSAILRALNINK